MKKISFQKTTDTIISFIQTSLKREGYPDVLIGVSGGIDSATSLALTIRSIDKKHVYPVILPYGRLNDTSTNDARKLLRHFAITEKNTITIDIQHGVDAFCSYDPAMDDARKGNVMARMRMIALYDLSKKMNALVIGTENKTEHLLGYYTRFGDEASDIEPLRDLYKTQVYEVAKYLDIPKYFLEKSPSAGLWDGQTDEKEFGFKYADVDEILYLYADEHMTKEDIMQKGYDPKLVERIWWWVEKGEFKARMPIIFPS